MSSKSLESASEPTPSTQKSEKTSKSKKVVPIFSNNLDKLLVTHKNSYESESEIEKETKGEEEKEKSCNTRNFRHCGSIFGSTR